MTQFDIDYEIGKKSEQESHPDLNNIRRMIQHVF